MDRVGAKGVAVACLDQAAASGGLFLVHVVLARVLDAAAYGRFAAMMAVALIGVAVLTAWVLDPYSARGRGGRRHRAAAAWLLAGAGAALAPPFLWPGAVPPVIAGPLQGAAVAPGLALAWFARRAAYADGRPGRALAVSGIWAVATAGMIGALVLQEVVTPERALLALGLAGVTAGLGSWCRWPGGRMVRAAVRWHVRHGAWLVAGVPLWVVATQAPLLALAWSGQAAEAGHLRVLHLAAMPVAQLMAALGTWAQPRVARAVARGELAAAQRQGWRVGAVLMAVAVPYVGALAWVGRDLLPWLFGPAQAVVAGWAPVAALAPLLACIAAGPNLVLRAQRRTAAVTAGTACAAACAGLGAVLVPNHGLTAAIGAGIAAALGNAVVLRMALAGGRTSVQAARA